MFYECKSLQKFSVISSKDIKLEIDENNNEQKNNQIDISNLYDSERINNKSSNHLNYSNVTNINSQEISLIKNTSISSKNRNKFNIIHFSNKNNIISDKEMEKINQIIIESKNHLFYLASFDLIDFQNNINQDNSIHENSFLSTESKIIKASNNTENKTLNGYLNLPALSLFKFSKRNNINVNNLSYMLSGCSSLKSLPDISRWNTDNLYDIKYLFSYCSSLGSRQIYPNGIPTMLKI